jgi:hypothetical protein
MSRKNKSYATRIRKTCVIALFRVNVVYLEHIKICFPSLWASEHSLVSVYCFQSMNTGSINMWLVTSLFIAERELKILLFVKALQDVKTVQLSNTVFKSFLI